MIVNTFAIIFALLVYIVNANLHHQQPYYCETFTQKDKSPRIIITAGTDFKYFNFSTNIGPMISVPAVMMILGDLSF